MEVGRGESLNRSTTRKSIKRGRREREREREKERKEKERRGKRMKRGKMSRERQMRSSNHPIKGSLLKDPYRVIGGGEIIGTTPIIGFPGT